jgi:hypothetical protein
MAKLIQYKQKPREVKRKLAPNRGKAREVEGKTSDGRRGEGQGTKASAHSGRAIVPCEKSPVGYLCGSRRLPKQSLQEHVFPSRDLRTSCAANPCRSAPQPPSKPQTRSVDRASCPDRPGKVPALSVSMGWGRELAGEGRGPQAGKSVALPWPFQDISRNTPWRAGAS